MAHEGLGHVGVYAVHGHVVAVVGGPADYALTPDGENYVSIEVTSVPEIEYSEIVDIIAIYNINGQVLNHKNIENLRSGIYIVQGSTANGKIITKKIVVNN